jgi:iron complex outermembrane receptor protein
VFAYSLQNKILYQLFQFYRIFYKELRFENIKTKMKKSIQILSILLAFFSVLIGNAYASSIRSNFSGTVKDAKTGLPIQGVSIYISDLKIGANTNSRGEFNLPNMSDGKHLVEVSHIGYNTVVEAVTVLGDTKRDYLLTESIVENNAVIVTGVTKATQLKKIPFQVSVLRKEDLQQSASTNIIDALSRKAGVSSLSTGPAISKPLIRGLGYNRVLTINDGVRQEGQQWGDEHGIEVDEASVSKIEVLKGPASLIYGSDAMAGVINIITNVPVANNSLKLNAGTNYQTNNRMSSIYGNIAGNVNGFNWNAYGTTKSASDFKNKYDGYVFNSKFNENNFGGYMGYNGSWGYSHLLMSNFNLKAGLVEAERDSLGNFVKTISGGIQEQASSDDFKSTVPQIPYQHIRHSKIAIDNSFKLGENSLSANLGWQHNQREEFGNPDDVHERSLYFDLKTLTYTTQLHFKESKGWKPSIGINGMKQSNTNKGIEQLIPDYSLFDIGAYTFLEKDLDKLTISGGARIDSRNINVGNLMDNGNIKEAGFKKSFSNFSGSIGAAYQATKKINVKLNLARAFRAPSIPELASNGAHEGTIRYEYGDKALKSELSTQGDAAIEYTTKHFTLNLACYYNAFSNFIFYRKLQSSAGADSVIVVNGSGLSAFKFDQQQAHLAGLEATLDIHPHPLDWLHLQNTFSLVSGKLSEQIEGTDNLPFIPAPKLLTELRADFKRINSVFKNFYMKVEFENTFKQSHPFTAFGTETATPSYTLVNAGVGLDILNSSGHKLMDMNLIATNITDVAYQSHLSRLKYADENLATGRKGVFNMGRNFSMKINVPLSFTIKK